MMQKLSAQDIKQIGVAVLYVGMSTSMTFFNKAVLSQYKFKFSFTILAVQLVITILVLKMLQRFKLIELESFTMTQARKVYIISILYSINVAIALSALAKLNIPMYSTLKRVAVCVVMFGEYIVLKKRQSIPIVISVVFIAIGAIVAGMGDLEFSFIGYLLGMLSCISQAGYLLFVAKKEEETGMSTFSLLFYNSAISLPFVVLMIFGTGELSGVLAYPRLFDFDFLLVLLGSSLLGSFLNYAIFLCATVTSPLTLTVSGQFKGIVTIGVGIFTFGGVKLTMMGVLGWIINSGASIAYSYLKFLDKNNPTPKRAPPSHDDNGNGVESKTQV